MKVTITLDIEDSRWFALAGYADEQGRKVGDVVTAEVRTALAKLLGPERDSRGRNPYAKDLPYRDEPRREICRRMWTDGHSIHAIAAKIGTPNTHKVGATIWDLGFDTTLRRGRPEAGIRRRPYTNPVPSFPPTRRGRPPKEDAA